MANIYVIACPDCGKQIKVPEETIGKKIRCKQCETIFPINESRAKLVPKTAPAAAPANKKETAKKQEAEDLENDRNPYALAKDHDDTPRCPHCVKELESADAKICLNCGYNLITRTRVETKKVYEATGGEVFMWLLPGIVAVIVIITLITVSIICMVKTTSWMNDGVLHEKVDGKDKYLIHPGCFKLFNGLLTAFICYHLGRYAYKRLVVNNKPPELLIQSDDEQDDEEGDDDEDD